MDNKSRKNGDNSSKRATLKDVNALSEKHGFELEKHEDHKRIYRKAAELPDPSKDHRAEVNRKTKLVNFRLAPELIDAIDKIAGHRGIPKATWLADVVKDAIKQELKNEDKPEPDN